MKFKSIVAGLTSLGFAAAAHHRAGFSAGFSDLATSRWSSASPPAAAPICSRV